MLTILYGGASITAPWVPTIEKENTVGPFISKTPEEIYKSDKAPIMDVMFSFASKEAVAFRKDLLESNEPLIKENVGESEVELPFVGFDKNTYPEEYKKSLQKLKKAYYSNSTSDEAIKTANINLMSDIIFGDSIIKSSILQSIVNNKGAEKKNTFVFRFSYDAGLNLFKLIDQLKYDGATHGDDLCYLFHCHMFDGYKLYDSHLEKKDVTYDVIMRMAQIVTNFARTGNPSIENDTPFESCKSPAEVFCQEITNDPQSTVTNNITNQLHYDTWREIEEIYKSLKM